MDEFDDTVIKDERLELIFTCCHPALPLEGQVALTLRALGGLETAEIARAFLVSEETMKRRLSRAKTKIKATGIPFAVPDAHLLPDRLDAVLAVVYLIYNEGYSGRVDLGRRSHPAGAGARRAHAGRAGGARAARADDDPPRPAAGPVLRRGPRAARRSGPFAVGPRADRGGTGGARPGDRAGRARRLRHPGGDRVAADRASGSTGRRSPRCTGGWSNSPARRWSSSTAPWRSPRPATPPRRCAPSTASTWTATSTSTRPAASCCGVSAATTEARAAYRRALELATSTPERRFLTRRLEQL